MCVSVSVLGRIVSAVPAERGYTEIRVIIPPENVPCDYTPDDPTILTDEHAFYISEREVDILLPYELFFAEEPPSLVGRFVPLLLGNVSVIFDSWKLVNPD